jgi:hypothetical protein
VSITAYHSFWRSGGVKHPHDTPPYPFMPSPTFAHSSIFVGALLSLRYKVFVLIPLIIVACAVLSGAGLAWNINASQIMLEVTAITTPCNLAT